MKMYKADGNVFGNVKDAYWKQLRGVEVFKQREAEAQATETNLSK